MSQSTLSKSIRLNIPLLDSYSLTCDPYKSSMIYVISSNYWGFYSIKKTHNFVAVHRSSSITFSCDLISKSWAMFFFINFNFWSLVIYSLLKNLYYWPSTLTCLVAYPNRVFWRNMSIWKSTCLQCWVTFYNFCSTCFTTCMNTKYLVRAPEDAPQCSTICWFILVTFREPNIFPIQC